MDNSEMMHLYALAIMEEDLHACPFGPIARETA